MSAPVATWSFETECAGMHDKARSAAEEATELTDSADLLEEDILTMRLQAYELTKTAARLGAEVKAMEERAADDPEWVEVFACRRDPRQMAMQIGADRA